MGKLTPINQYEQKKRYLASRVKKAKRMLALFYYKDDMQTSTVDCIADLMHLATAQGFSYQQAQEQGLRHHTEEQARGEHG